MQTDAEHSWLPVRWSDWISFLCTESSARPLAIVRICLGSYLFIYWIELASFLDLYFLAPPMLFLDDLTTVPWYGAIRLVGESTFCRQLLFVGTGLYLPCDWLLHTAGVAVTVVDDAVMACVSGRSK